MRRILGSILAGLVVWLGGSLAHGQTRVAVLGVEAVDAPAELAHRIALALRAQTKRAPSLRLVAGKSLEEIKLVFGCVDEQPTCMARVGRDLGAAKLLWGTLKKSGSGYNLTIKFLDVSTASIEKFVSEDVTAVDLAGRGAGAVVARLTAAFLPGARGALRINSNVEGATVEVGGQPVGVTQAGGLLVGELAPGSYAVRVSKPGYRVFTQTASVIAEETTYVDALLPEAAELPPPPPSSQPAAGASRSGWKIAFWTSAALTAGFGAGLIGSGVTVLNKQDEKDQAIRESGDLRQELTANVDVCARAAQLSSPQAQRISDACSSGETYATLTNVFIGLTVAAAGASGYFYYKAFIQKQPENVPPSDEGPTGAERAVKWTLVPSAGPRGAGLGFNLRF